MAFAWAGVARQDAWQGRVHRSKRSGALRNNKWFVVPSPRQDPALRLVCFPYAGGAAATYIPWNACLPEDVELVCVQPPGRASRITEVPHRDMVSLVNDLSAAFREVADRPYVLFGHSLGSRVAYELARRYRGQCSPSLLIASGSAAPHYPRMRTAIHDLPDAAFVERLRELNGTPREVLDNEELIGFLIPLLRADFQIADHRCEAERLDCPITVLWGTEDPEVNKEAVQGWREVSGDPCDIHQIQGDHFFLERNRPAVLEKVCEALHLLMARKGAGAPASGICP